MRLFSTIVFFLLALSSSNAQGLFTVSGHLKNLADQEMMIMQRKNYEDVELSRTKCKNGSFELSGSIREADLVMLVIPRIDKSLRIFLEPGTTKINGDMAKFDQVKVTESKPHAEYLLLNAKLKPYTDKMAEIRPTIETARKAKDRAAFDLAYNKYKQVQSDRDEAIMAYFEANNASIVASSYIAPMYFNEKDVNVLKSVFAKFSPKLKGTQHYDFFEKRIEDLEKLNVGKVAPDMSFATPEGDQLALSSLRGKYVLIDFWASWCGPCRSENPNVVRLYDTYKEKNFEIYGVSLDMKRDAWLKAIEDDKLTWKQVSDLKGWKSGAAKIYSINSIPQTFLIDPKGVIIAKNLRGAALEEKLKEIFK